MANSNWSKVWKIDLEKRLLRTDTALYFTFNNPFYKNVEKNQGIYKGIKTQ